MNDGFITVLPSTKERLERDLARKDWPHVPTFVDELAARSKERFGVGQSTDDRRRLRNARKRARKAAAEAARLVTLPFPFSSRFR